VQPVQLSLIPDQVPTPPAALVEHLPDPAVAAATGLLPDLIAKAASPPTAGDGGGEAGDE
jgi:hypothetical protein